MSCANRLALTVVALCLSLGCHRGPDATMQAELQRDVTCKEHAQSWCREKASQAGQGGFDLDQCVSKRAFDCEVGQTPEDMRARYQVGLESPAPADDQLRNPDAALGNSYEGIRMQDEAAPSD